jgi:hypothetical protein
LDRNAWWLRRIVEKRAFRREMLVQRLMFIR